LLDRNAESPADVPLSCSYWASQFFDFASRQKHSVLTLDRDTTGGLAISPDHKSLLFSQEKLKEANIAWVKNFQ